MHFKTTFEDMPDLIAKVNLRLVPISAYGNITLCYKHNTLGIWSNFDRSINNFKDNLQRSCDDTSECTHLTSGSSVSFAARSTLQPAVSGLTTSKNTKDINP